MTQSKLNMYKQVPDTYFSILLTYCYLGCITKFILYGRRNVYVSDCFQFWRLALNSLLNNLHFDFLILQKEYS